MDAKQFILRTLSRSDDIISGETLSTRLGISRVSVWKHIQSLIKAGIPITSSPKGYRLSRDPDSLMPWACGDWGDRVHYFPETTSTMDEARILARRGCPDFSVAVTQRQTQGRGRMQRRWASMDGGLYFSVVLRPDIPVMQAGLVNLAAAIEMAGLLRSRYRVDAGLKWPNDILVEDRKICGLLSQMEAEGERVAGMTIGIGLNVNNQPERDAPLAVSLQSLLGRPVPRPEILTAFLEAFERRMAQFDPVTVIADWKAGNITLGREVRVETIHDRLEGRAVDIDVHGGLILQLANGRRQTVVYGDCFHQ